MNRDFVKELPPGTYSRLRRFQRVQFGQGAELRWRVAQKLALQWSPEQISGWLKQKFSTDQDMQISHEAIYRSLFIQTRGVLKKELTAQLRTARRMRRPKNHNAKSGQGHRPARLLRNPPSRFDCSVPHRRAPLN
jgi:IS30 family transposase